ncbi:MAG: MFS transporter, partial [Gammaproteobacteria bacterium]|nr:MFS transporter [Gammaproteobacteria bacterium]
MWAMMAFFSFFQFFMQISGNLMESAWQNAFHINQTMVGFLSSSFFYGYILVQIPAGFFFDAIGMKKVIRIAVSLFVFGMILLTATSSIYCGLLGRLMMGSGAGFAFIAMVYSAASWFGPALLTAFVGMGEMLSMLLTAGAQAGTP